MKKYNIGISAVIAILAGILFYATKGFPEIVQKVPGAGFWPRILAVVLLILSVALLLESLFSDQVKKEDPIRFRDPRMKKVYLALGMLALYMLILVYGGFIISSLLLVPALMYLLGERRVKMLIIVSLALTGTIYLFFTLLLRITLPQPFFM